MNTDSLVFQGSVKTSNSNNIANLTVSGITFAQGASPFVLSGNRLTSTGDIVNSSSSLQTFNMAMAVGANQTWDGGSQGLNFNQGVTIGNYALTLTNRARLTYTWTNIDVGTTALGSLKVQNASEVSSYNSYIGSYSTGVGNATVSGAGSKWSSQTIDVAFSGKGTLNVENGGQVSSNSSITMGSNSTGLGNATVTGAGSKLSSQSIYVGYAGNGTLNVENGGLVNSNTSYIGNSRTGVGTARVSGADSKLSSTSKLYVGYDGKGTLTVENGGLVTSTHGYIGENFSGVGIATVTGNGSQWNNSGALVVGNLGTGTLNINDSGVVSTAVFSIGSRGIVNLDGGTLQVGSVARGVGSTFNWLKGTLSITGTTGATVGSGLLGSTTTLDAGKTLNVTNTLTVGNGRVLVLNGGEVNAKSTNLSNGTIRSTGLIDISRTGNISGSGSLDGAVTGGLGKTIAASGGDLKLGNVAARDAYAFAGNLEVGSRQVDLLSANQAQLGTTTSLATGGKLNAINGAYLGSGNTLAFSGNSSVAGNFTNNGNVVGSAGTLSFLNDVNGAGSYAGNVAFKAAFNPGNSPATVSFNSGNVTFDSGSVLNMEIFGSTPGAQYDQLVNINTLTFNGTLNLVFSNGYVPLAGSSFALFGFNTINGSLTQDNITVTGYDRSRLDFSQLATNGSVSVTAVPEPETYAMLLAGLGLMGAIVRRRRANLSA
ncbi:PEP-CTERM protein-sorting domain [Comamonadaceae bacterium]